VVFAFGDIIRKSTEDYKMREEYDGLDEMPDVIRREEEWI